MHDGMPYDLIQGQGQGHETFKVRNFQFSKSISSSIFNVSWQMTTDSETVEQYLNFIWTRFSISVLVFVSRDYELGTKFIQFANAFAIAITFARWRRHSKELTGVPYGSNFLSISFTQSSQNLHEYFTENDIKCNIAIEEIFTENSQLLCQTFIW